ncbi:MAG TPA: FCD domain-containing protein [Trebonia sp.]
MESIWEAGMAELGPVTVRSAVDELCDRLLTAFALGEFSVGERLPAERELAVTLGLSRPTVRAALARLRKVGFVDVVRGRSGGYFVRSGWQDESAEAVRRMLLPRWERSRELLDTRCLVESLIARTAAVRHDAADLPAIEEALEAHRVAATDHEIRGTDAALHAAIARAAHNDRLPVFSAELLAEVAAGFPIEPFRGTYVERARHEHAELVAAITARDAERAADIAQAHFTITAEALSELVAAATETSPPLAADRGTRESGDRNSHPERIIATPASSSPPA